ncbi:MAG: trimeric intracellular cation channel family protein, partial [Verrucomicrobiaceae bacterium]
MSAAFEILSTRLPYLLEHFAVAVAAVSGVLAGRGKNVDLFGVLVLALVTAFGGGTLRDIMVGDTPVVWIRDSTFVTTVTAAAVATFVYARFYAPPRRLLLIADAIALALMTVIGAKKALGFEVAPIIAVTMGVITG